MSATSNISIENTLPHSPQLHSGLGPGYRSRAASRNSIFSSGEMSSNGKALATVYIPSCEYVPARLGVNRSLGRTAVEYLPTSRSPVQREEPDFEHSDWSVATRKRHKNTEGKGVLTIVDSAHVANRYELLPMSQRPTAVATMTMIRSVCRSIHAFRPARTSSLRWGWNTA